MSRRIGRRKCATAIYPAEREHRGDSDPDRYAVGIAGIVAYRDQRADRKARKLVQHIPVEVRPLLLEICRVAGELERRAQSRAWIDTHLTALDKQWRPLAHVSIAAMKGDQLDFAEVSVHLHDLSVSPIPDAGSDPAGHQAAMAQQHSSAHDLLDAATNLHARLLGQERPFPKASDGRNIPRRPRGLRTFCWR